MTFQVATQADLPKSQVYENLKAQLTAVFENERDFIANSANLSSLLFHSLPDLNWVGFYLNRSDELVLGPFQGKPACVRIALGKGVCGTAAWQRQTIIVDNVNDFPGHIACDSASNSEIVVPLMSGDRLIGVLDLDSPSLSRFDETDARGLNALVNLFLGCSDLSF